MGLRDSVKKGLRGILNKMSGEYSAVAPEEIKPMERPGKPDPDAKIQWANLNRPKAGAGGGNAGSGGADEA